VNGIQNNNSSRWKRLWVGIIGGTVLLFGIALIVLPGPAFIVIPAGLAILATEFAWAGHWLQKIRGFMQKQRGRFKRKSL
jgi:tellurite resistance protein TerC